MNTFHELFLRAQAVRRVAIVGGTHGNEATGVAVARYLARHPTAARRPSFETMTILANTAAIAANTRYVDEDLNRCFLSELLGDASRASGEAARARELDLLIGPKGSEQAHDLVIDLHNTTSNSGIALMSRYQIPACRVSRVVSFCWASLARLRGSALVSTHSLI